MKIVEKESPYLMKMIWNLIIEPIKILIIFLKQKLDTSKIDLIIIIIYILK
jgi:hypothetical protein